MRILCLYLPQFPLQACLFAEPALRGQAVAIVQAQGNRNLVIAASPEAAGIYPSMLVQKAKAICPSLLIRPFSLDQLRAAEDRLRTILKRFSPTIQYQAGSFLLDITSLRTLFGSEGMLATQIDDQVQKLGFCPQIAIAKGPQLARLLAQNFSGVTVISAGQEASSIAALPVGCLCEAEALKKEFRRLGIHTLGEFAKLPRESLASRFGKDIVALHQIACGEEEPLFCGETAPFQAQASMQMEDSIDNLESLTFVLRRLFVEALAQLKQRSLACQSLRLSFTLSPRGHEERMITLGYPSRDEALLVRVARLHILAQPVKEPIAGILVELLPTLPPPIQESLFSPPSRAKEDWMSVLAQLEALCGKDHIGSPQPIHSYQLGAWKLVPFQPFKKGNIESHFPLEMGLGLELFRVPLPTLIDWEHGKPSFVRSAHVSGLILKAGGPYRCREVGLGIRDYYEIELSQGRLYLLFQNRESGDWFLGGSYG